MPLTHSFAALHLPSPSGSQFLPYRRQTALRSVAAHEPHAAAIGSTLRANELRWSIGKDSRTTLPPVCGTFHSHSLLRSLPMRTTCRARTERCSSLRSSRIVYRPTHCPRCGWRSGPVRLVGDELVVADIGSRLTYSRVSRRQAALTPDICHRQTRASGSFGIDFVFFLLARHSASKLALCSCFVRQFPLRPAPQSGGESACACGLWLDTDGDSGSAYGSLRCNRVSACCAAPTPDWLFTASAQCSVKSVPQRLCRARGTLSAVNRLVLHSHSLQAQCFAAGASRVVGGVSLPEVLHYARRTPSASPPFEHSPTSPQSRHKCRLCRE